MRIWLSGEIDVPVEEKDRLISNKIEKTLNACLENKKYGDGLVVWGHINIILKEGLLPDTFFREIKKYHPRNKETDFRLKIDYERFLKADEKEAFKLICKSILRSIQIGREELRIPDFDIDDFEADIKSCFAKEGWL